MLARKKLTDFTNLISPYDLKKNDDIILSDFKDKWNWKNKLVRRDQISTKWNNRNWKLFSSRDSCSHAWKSCSKKLSKYVVAFDYIDKILVVLSATSSGVCIISPASVVGALVGIVSASFTLIFSLTTGIIKKLLSITRSKK